MDEIEEVVLVVMPQYYDVILVEKQAQKGEIVTVIGYTDEGVPIVCSGG